MKKFKRAIAWLVALYLIISLALSAIVSLNVHRWEIVVRRKPFLIVSLERSTVESVRDDGCGEGHNRQGEYIGFGYPSEGYEIGAEVLSAFVYNPLTNWNDDIMTRFDWIL